MKYPFQQETYRTSIIKSLVSLIGLHLKKHQHTEFNDE